MARFFGASGAYSAKACTACAGAVAQTTASNASSPTCHWPADQRGVGARSPRRTAAPRVCSQRAAACGNKADRSARGSSRSEPAQGRSAAVPGAAPSGTLSRVTGLSVSYSTVKKTWPLACCAGVFRAETHKGSIKLSITCGRMPTHNSATVAAALHSKWARCQRRSAFRSDHLSPRLQPRAPSTPANWFQGWGQSGRRRPLPSGNCSVRGRRSSSSAGSRPTVRIKSRVSR